MIDEMKKKDSKRPVQTGDEAGTGQDSVTEDETGDPISDEAGAPVFPVVDTELENTRQALAQMTENWQRERASFQNFKHRVEEEKREIRKYACFDFALEIIRIMDYFESSVTFSENLPEGAQNVIIGVKYTLTELTKVLAEIEVHPIEAEKGQPFDSVLMQAVERRPSDLVSEGNVLEVTRRGWRMHDRVMRPAQVVVADLISVDQDKSEE